MSENGSVMVGESRRAVVMAGIDAISAASEEGPASSGEALVRAKGVRVRQFVGRGGVRARVDVLERNADDRRRADAVKAVEAFEAEQGIVEELGDAGLARLWCNTLLAELEGRDPAPDGLWELFEGAQELWAGLEERVS